MTHPNLAAWKSDLAKNEAKQAKRAGHIEHLKQKIAEAAQERFATGTEVFIRAKITEGPDDDGDVEAMYVMYDGRAGFSFFKPDRVSPVSDWISRAEHDRLIAEAKDQSWREGHNAGYAVAWEHHENASKFVCTCDPAKGEACSDCQPVTPYVPKLTAGDCVDYLIKEYALDTGHQSETKLRSYCRDRDGVKYTVSVCRTADFEPNAPVVVAPVGVVEEIHQSVIGYAIAIVRNRYSVEANNQWQLFRAALSKLVTLPEPKTPEFMSIDDAGTKSYGDGSLCASIRIVVGDEVRYMRSSEVPAFAAALIAAAQGGK